MVTKGISSELDLQRLNFSRAWQQEDGAFCPTVSRYTHAELASGLPFHTDSEPVRFTRNKTKVTRLKGQAEVYAMRWLARFNRRLEKGLF
jgi:hypothetical protein